MSHALAICLKSAAIVAAFTLFATARPANAGLNPSSLSSGDRNAIARVAFAEAAGQGDSGLAGVIYVILNRRSSGLWGHSIDAVLNSRAQFEPVTKAGGDWRQLPSPSAAQQARIDTIINLISDGHLPDLTNGARYFQNPTIVSARALTGAVPTSLVRFGGRRPSAVIGSHEFFSLADVRERSSLAHEDQGGGPIFFADRSISSPVN